MSDFRVIQGCPANSLIAPYIAIVVADAKATVNSIYRGSDAAVILHKHGKHTQAEEYDLFIHHHGAPADKSGQSTHELFSDGIAYPGPVGRKLDLWQQGFDVNDSDVPRVIAAARRYGWVLFQPYHSKAEFHHLNFARRPRPTPRTLARIVYLRRTLPRT